MGTGPPSRGPECSRVPQFGKCSAVAVVKFLIIFQQEVPHLHFVLGLTNYVTVLALG